MKHFLLLLSIFFCAAAYAQTPAMEKIWETDSIVAVPESVLPDAKRNVLFVSLIDGAPWEADGKGGIARLSMDGKNYNGNWVSGLNAPKGMGIFGNRLYVADMNEVVVIDIEKAKIETKIAPDGAQSLNDITIDDKGIVYVSDSKGFRIWRIENDKPVLYLENLPGLNGLKAVGSDLIIASGKSFVKADASKNIQKIADLPQGGDGIEPVGNGDYIVTAWAGYVFYVHADGKVDTIMDTHLEKRNTADIGYDPVNRVIYVPTFFAKTIAAYKLKIQK